jgi:hypothetical protein
METLFGFSILFGLISTPFILRKIIRQSEIKNLPPLNLIEKRFTKLVEEHENKIDLYNKMSPTDQFYWCIMNKSYMEDYEREIKQLARGINLYSSQKKKQFTPWDTCSKS